MKIAILTQYFPPTSNACSARMSAFARGLKAEGHEVVVLSGMPNYPTGIKPPAYRRKLYVKEEWEGIPVHRTYESATANEGYIRRTLNYVSFMLSAMFGVFLLPRCDVLIVTSPPLFVTLSARWLAFFKARHLVVDVRDLWPRIVCELGHAKAESPGMRWLRHLELRAYRAAGLISAATGGLRREIEATCTDVIGIERDVRFYANGIVEDMPREASDYERDPNVFTLVFAGTLTPHYDFHQILDFAAALLAETDATLRGVRILLVGDGDLRQELSERVARDALTNVSMRGWTPHAQMLDIVSKCDLCLVPLFTGGLFDCALPVKMFEGMYCGLPVLTNGVADLRELLTEAGCAYFFDSQDYPSFRSAVREAIADPNARAAKAEAGKRVVVQDFERVKIVRQLSSTLEATFGPHQGQDHDTHTGRS